ncbi:MAG: ferritin-like domain-containing protein [Candidatus Binatia bacterium]
MSISHVISSGWRRFLAAFRVSDQQTLLETLCDAYRTEADTVMRYTQRADQMYYPQFRAELLRIAAEVQAHLPWLREQIGALGGNLPSSTPRPTPEQNSWECLRRDVEEARRGCDRLLEWIHRVEREEPALAVGLGRIRKDKLRHREELRQLLMKSDPYTTTVFPQHQNAHRTQA